MHFGDEPLLGARGLDGLVFNDLSFISFLPFYYVIAVGLDDGYL